MPRRRFSQHMSIELSHDEAMAKKVKSFKKRYVKAWLKDWANERFRYARNIQFVEAYACHQSQPEFVMRMVFNGTRKRGKR